MNLCHQSWCTFHLTEFNQSGFGTYPIPVLVHISLFRIRPIRIWNLFYSNPIPILVHISPYGIRPIMIWNLSYSNLGAHFTLRNSTNHDLEPILLQSWCTFHLTEFDQSGFGTYPISILVHISPHRIRLIRIWNLYPIP